MSQRHPLRILVVTAMYPRTAAPTDGIFVKEQVESLRRLGDRVDVLVIDGWRGKHQYLLGCARVLAATVRRDYDVVHGHYGYAGLAARCQVRAPTVVTLHGSDVNLRSQRPFARLAAQLADETIVVSSELARLAALSSAHVIPCGVDLSLFRPLDKSGARQAQGIASERSVVLFAGDPARAVKRFDRFETAVARLRGARDVDVLTLSGTPRELVPVLLNAADCLVLTSDSEGSPMVIREALACNTPIVSVDVGDVRQQLDGVTQSEIVDTSPLAIAAGIERVLSGGQRSNGRTRAAQFDLDLTATRVHDIYERLAARARRRAAHEASAA